MINFWPPFFYLQPDGATVTDYGPAQLSATLRQQDALVGAAATAVVLIGCIQPDAKISGDISSASSVVAALGEATTTRGTVHEC